MREKSGMEMVKSKFCVLLVLLVLQSSDFLPVIEAQQPYINNHQPDCYNKAYDNLTKGFDCNGVKSTCQSYLTFRSNPLYNSAAEIGYLLKAEPTFIASINNLTSDVANIPTDTQLVVPVNCSCSGQYYQHNATYQLRNRAETYFTVANNTFQGLSTCQAMMAQNTVGDRNLTVGLDLLVPLRCACPTPNQTASGVRYLLSYMVTSGDTIAYIADLFRADVQTVLAANQLSQSDTIYPFTTVLVPLKNPPTKIEHPPQSSPPAPAPQTPPGSSPDESNSSKWVYVGVGIGAGLLLLVALLGLLFCFHRRRRATKTESKPVPVLPPKKFSESTDYSALPNNSKSFPSSVSSQGFRDAVESLTIYSNVSEEKVSTLPSDSSIEPKVSEGSSETEVELEKTSEDSNMEAKVPEGIIEGVNCQSITVDDNAALDDHTDDDPVEKEKRLATCPSDNVNVQTEIDNSQESVVISRDVPHEGGVASEYGDQNGPVSIPVHVGNGDIQFTGEGSNDKTCHQVEAIDEPHRDEAPTSTPESSVAASEAQNVRTEAGTAPEAQNVGTEAGTAPEAQNVGTEAGTAPEAQNVGTEVVKRPFYCLIKVPRFDDENLKEQIKLFQLKVDEKTRSRDAIRDTIHTRRATFKENGENLEAAILEEKAAREMLKSKRQEIDSLQSVINKVKNAISVEDIDGRIRQIRHMIEHETVPLKEEKQLIREIEQLKQHREQFSSSMGKQDEIQQAFDQKDQIEERLKVLRKEADSLRENVSKAEAATQAARKKHKDESEKLRELQAQFKAADDIRQDAYKSLQNLRKQAYDKNKYFWNYKDDVKAANDLLFKGDKEALLNLCDNQVERVLEMWNDNDEFRKEYVRSNINSTVRRLKTLDGRSLGPNEEPPVIRSVVINRVARDNSAPQISTVKEEKPEQVVPVKTEKENKSVLVKTEKENKSMTKVGVQKDQAAKSQWPAKPAIVENGSATVSGRIEIEEPREEEPKRTKEEEELARKTEELKKKEEAAKLKEQRRLEEKVKAKEALERKKRIAEKAQARAALRAQKEAEQKEKDTSVTNEEDSAPITETPTETPTISDVKDKSTTVTKKPKKQSQFTKQTKLKSVPLPLRNRGKRRMQSWMWVLIAALVVFALFLLGNSGFPFKSCLQWFGF
ncbi:hypothetical protein JRO89_XS07G0001300 [Xanthoceras sorbifolium]|uniref:LysM domain-containing protein n=1 Tax=Xanthoceras sorbifolium TaxID=99658 RepID=A0ABQ8HRP1_9ROSI|nr:hypothetical protein JRO89_XS07G0001300 [Xanthoceras sorbifolium]